MGQTSGSNTGSLELLKKIGEQGEKLMPNSFQNKIYTSFSNSDDIKTVLQNLFDSYIDDKFYKVILRPEGGGASSIAEIYKAGVNLGVVKVRNHAGVDLIGTKNGTWTWDSYVTKSYIDSKSKLKTYDGDGCAVKIFGETAIVIISAGKFAIIKGGNNNENVIATLPSNIRIPGSFILWQQVTLVSENWTPINDTASIVDIKNSNGIVMRCSFDHSNVEHIYGSIIIPSELVTITS